MNKSWLLESKIAHLTYKKTLQWVVSVIKKKQTTYICVAAVHLIIESYLDEKVRAAVNKAGIVTTDGMPLVWWLRWLGVAGIERVYGPELMLRLCDLAEQKGWSVALVGGAVGQSKLLKKSLGVKFPHLNVAVVFDTPQRLQNKRESDTAVRLLKIKKPQLVFVGIGCPLQELWMEQAVDKMPNGVVLVGVGAAFDFISGKVRQAPPFLQRIGLEWFFRLWQEPRRLWRRYFFYNTLFVLLVAREVLWTRFLKKYF